MDISIFKSYDIRGTYPDQLDEDAAYRIGRAYVEFIGAKSIAVGRDNRPSGNGLFKAFAKGATESGADVVDLGIVTTPMVYFAAGSLPVDGAVSLTASHNPPEYNGFKLNRRGAVPIGAGSGMEDIRDLAESGEFKRSPRTGTVSEMEIATGYIDHVVSYADLDDAHLSVVVDTANAVGALELPVFKKLAAHVELATINEELDPSFPNHEANPLKTETLEQLSAAVKKKDAHIGIAYDGDADRVGFIDENGEPVRMDTITTLLSLDILKTYPKSTILYDLRSSKAVAEEIEAAGGTAIQTRVGHAHIKKHMRDVDAVFAGELSGHYYFKDNSYAESATLAAVLVLNMLARSGETLSALAKKVERYHHSGEINSTVKDVDGILGSLLERYGDGEITALDGLKVTYPTWWFNVRASNTEPLLRLNLEADTKELLDEKREELLAIIRS
jgi:phosphomannomutase